MYSPCTCSLDCSPLDGCWEIREGRTGCAVEEFEDSCTALFHSVRLLSSLCTDRAQLEYSLDEGNTWLPRGDISATLTMGGKYKDVGA